MDDNPSTPSADRENEIEAALTFGQKLRSERESKGLSLEDVADTTRVGIHLLRALEEDDFDVLPDDVFVKGHLRAYADCLGADPDLVIEAYNLERQSRAAAQAATEETGSETVVGEMSRVPNVPDKADTRRRGGLSPWLTAFGIVAVLAILGTWWINSSERAESPPNFPVPEAAVQGVNETAPALRAATTVPLETPVVVVPAETLPKPSEPEPPPVEKPVLTMLDPTTLTIPSYGVGTAVENRQLVGESDRFTEGTKVWFWTHVRSGTPGDKIHHVWLREGVEKTRVSLNIGGSRWRTQSNKMLWPESAGNWAVEARDDSGYVLARREFVCVP